MVKIKNLFAIAAFIFCATLIQAKNNTILISQSIDLALDISRTAVEINALFNHKNPATQKKAAIQHIAADLLGITRNVVALNELQFDSAARNEGNIIAYSSSIGTYFVDMLIHLKNLNAPHGPQYKALTVPQASLLGILHATELTLNWLSKYGQSYRQQTPEFQTALHNIRAALDSLEKIVTGSSYNILLDANTEKTILLALACASIVGNLAEAGYHGYKAYNRNLQSRFVDGYKGIGIDMHDEYENGTKNRGCIQCGQHFEDGAIVFGTCHHVICTRCAAHENFRSHLGREKTCCHTCNRESHFNQETKNAIRAAINQPLPVPPAPAPIFPDDEEDDGADGINRPLPQPAEDNAAPLPVGAHRPQLLRTPAAGEPKAARQAWLHAHHIVGAEGCPICLEEELDAELIIKLPCNHLICQPCCQQEINTGNEPIDRFGINDAGDVVQARRKRPRHYNCPQCRHQADVRGVWQAAEAEE